MLLRLRVDDEEHTIDWAFSMPRHFVWRGRCFTHVKDGVYECSGTCIVLDDDLKANHAVKY